MRATEAAGFIDLKFGEDAESQTLPSPDCDSSIGEEIYPAARET